MLKKAIINFKDNYGNLQAKPYHYWTDLEDLKNGDLVVVQVRDTVAIAQFTRYTTMENFEATRWLVQKVEDNATLEERIKVAQEEQQKAIRAKELRNELENRMIEARRLSEYSSVLTSDEDKELIDEYKKLIAA